MTDNTNSKENKASTISIDKTNFYVIVAVIIAAFLLLAWPQAQTALPYFHTPTPPQTKTHTPTQAPTATRKPSPTPSPSHTPQPTTTSTPYSYQFAPDFGTLILSIQEGMHSHLFAYSPLLKPQDGNYSGLPLRRLTSGNHQDITPALSPDGTRLAFSSNRSGVWDIYILNLTNGQLQRFTETKQYEAHPSWSPDGNWLAFEAYQENNLEIILQELDGENAPINLTNHPGSDHSPSWSSEGRKVSFISTRNGTSQIWVVDLDRPEKAQLISSDNSSANRVKHPTWSPDGRYLTWGSITDTGVHRLFTWDSQHPNRNPQPAGSGDWPLWSGNGQLLFTIIETPHENYLTAYPTHAQELKVMLPAVSMPGTVHGLTWGENVNLEQVLGPAEALTPTALWPNTSSSPPTNPGDRVDLEALQDVQAPYPKLSEIAAPSFNKLRSIVSGLTGWDFLATLDNAYLPLTTPSDPIPEQNWLYTGRGFAVNPLPLEAGWMVLGREDFGSQTYWRIYIKALSQTGSQGKPLHTLPWNFDVQHGGQLQAYERGGTWSSSVPEGYWVDFTSVAQAYGWQRLPALPRWQTSFSHTRYQTFVFTNVMDWQSAMLEIYPPEALYTPTPDPALTP